MLVIPKKPIGGVSDAVSADEAILGHLFLVASEVHSHIKAILVLTMQFMHGAGSKKVECGARWLQARY